MESLLEDPNNYWSTAEGVRDFYMCDILLYAFCNIDGNIILFWPTNLTNPDSWISFNELLIVTGPPGAKSGYHVIGYIDGVTEENAIKVDRI